MTSCEKTLFPVSCEISKVIELSEEEYRQFCGNLLASYPFLEDCQKDRKIEDGGWHYALILGKGQEDGILVCADAANVPVYMSYVSNARWIYQTEQYPGLFRFNQDMIKAADRFVQKAVEKQQNGIYRMQKHELYDSLDEIPAQAAVLTEMLENRTEISYLENTDEEVIVQLSQNYVCEAAELPALSQEEADIKCARHLLWLLGTEDGRQAVFSGYDLSGLDLSRRRLNQAVFTGSRMTETNLEDTELCFADFGNAQLMHCSLKGITAEEAVFQNTLIEDCDCEGAYFTHSDFTEARILDSCMDYSHWNHCFGERILFGNTSAVQAVIPEMIRQQWQNQKNEAPSHEMSQQ